MNCAFIPRLRSGPEFVVTKAARIWLYYGARAGRLSALPVVAFLRSECRPIGRTAESKHPSRAMRTSSSPFVLERADPMLSARCKKQAPNLHFVLAPLIHPCEIFRARGEKAY